MMTISDERDDYAPAADAAFQGGTLAPAAEIEALYASDTVGLTLISRDMTFVRINRALAETNGLPPEAHVGRRVADVVPDVARQAARMMAEVIRTRSPIGPFDMVGETPACPGDVRIWTQSWTPVFGADGEVVAASIISIDVTEARRAQEALLARADDVRRVLDGVIAFVGRLDPDGTLTEANQPAIDAGGIAREDVIGRKFWDCYWWSFSEASRARLRAAVARAAQGEAQRYDAEIRVAGDARMWIDFQLIPQRDAAGRVVEIVPSAVDITERRRAEAALRTNLERLRTILTTAQVGIAIAHADGRVTEANGSFLDMIGRSVEELRAGEIDWREHVSVDSALGWRRLLRNRTLGPLELTLRRRGGRELPTLASAGLLDTPERELVGFFLDRTRQEADAAHRELLLLELKHRVKNMLATAQAIARQTARHHEDREDLVEAFTGRLHAMARAHDLITERNSGQVCLRDLIVAQVCPYASRDGQLDWEGPAMQVQADVANSLGLVLHEMATNAAKYGALSTPDGTVSIRWQAEAGGRRVRITWAERGGPPVAPPQRRGFGTSLIESSLSHAHGGELALDYAPDGLRADMCVPAGRFDG
jgi:PAS domain S-box-containing protein